MDSKELALSLCRGESESPAQRFADAVGLTAQSAAEQTTGAAAAQAVKAVDKYGNTALHLAARSAPQQSIALLLSAGVAPSCP